MRNNWDSKLNETLQWSYNVKTRMYSLVKKIKIEAC